MTITEFQCPSAILTAKMKKYCVGWRIAQRKICFDRNINFPISIHHLRWSIEYTLTYFTSLGKIDIPPVVDYPIICCKYYLQHAVFSHSFYNDLSIDFLLLMWIQLVFMKSIELFDDGESWLLLLLTQSEGREAKSSIYFSQNEMLSILFGTLSVLKLYWREFIFYWQ